MSYADHAANILRAINELKATRVVECNKIMHDDLALVKSRVINTGKLSDGGTAGGYSQAVVPSPFYVKNLLRMNFTSPIAKLKEIQKKHGWHFSYETFRKETGRETAFKNFSLSGKMWKAVEAMITGQTNESITYELGSPDPEVQKLIDYNTAQSGDFLLQSPDERKLISDLNRQRVLRILQKHKLA